MYTKYQRTYNCLTIIVNQGQNYTRARDEQFKMKQSLIFLFTPSSTHKILYIYILQRANFVELKKNGKFI